MKGTAYLLQAALISIWWIGLLIDEDFYKAFQFPGIGKTAFNAFMLPDLVIIAFLSLIRAYKKIKELDFLILGGFGFATLYCVNASFLTRGGYLSTTVMVLGLAYNTFLINENRIFKNSNTHSFTQNLVKTIFQIICVWSLTLLVLPMLILNSFNVSIELSNYKEIGFLLLVIFSSFGVYSAIVMVKIGGGTPLPLDQAQNLVATGPYKFVRNPMAISGIGQGIAVSIILWSIHILIYSLIGALLWHFVVRPMEEKDLKQRFGNEYEEYRMKVKCWLPTLK